MERLDEREVELGSDGDVSGHASDAGGEEGGTASGGAGAAREQAAVAGGHTRPQAQQHRAGAAPGNFILEFNINMQATEGKVFLEQKQRDEAKERKVAGEKWEQRLFAQLGENWTFKQPLSNRHQ